ncbi:unnamed protein product [Nezara viridula]|uniref:Phosphatidylinositol-specific phospholipase C X domain-containing protein n=1 Tax=Nezara viridula TaxID=85310 RepID=A0A9P0E9C6_NEZVI|nr:unnamed protein product [Nezara viridula]
MEFRSVFLLTFILYCFSDSPVLGEDASNWMSNHNDILGRRSLKEICIPGSHDSGMSTLTKSTALADSCNVLTQKFPIKDQLQFGARYFDVRPVLDNGEFVTGHYIKLVGSHYQGGNGQSIKSILDEINNFISTQNELVLVRLSKSLNTQKSRPFDSDEWERLFQMLDNTKNLFSTPDETICLPEVTLDEFTNNGTKGAVLYIIYETGVHLGARLGNGYFYYSNLDPYSKYSNTHDLNAMMNDQIQKMKDNSRKKYFLLSWTLTQGFMNSAFCKLGIGGKSIEKLSEEANRKLKAIVPKVNSNAFPNILYVDYIQDSSVLETVMEINNRIDHPAPVSKGTLFKNDPLVYIVLLINLFRYIQTF